MKAYLGHAGGCTVHPYRQWTVWVTCCWCTAASVGAGDGSYIAGQGAGCLPGRQGLRHHLWPATVDDVGLDLPHLVLLDMELGWID